MTTPKGMTQIERLKRDGLYGTAGDPFWNKKTKTHECCGTRRSYYHRKGCKACAGDTIEADNQEGGGQS